MELSKNIGELLFEYECIVIPDLGGFITNNIPAKIQNDQRTFIPPTKKIVFNAYLKTNDGLLINQIAKTENISYSEARNKVQKFVEKCFVALNEGKKINFQNVGILFFDEEKNIQFKADITQNYLGESYGMTSFISPPVKRQTSHRIIEKTFVDRKQKQKSHTKEKVKNKQDYKKFESPKVKRPRYIHINVFTLVVIASIVYFGVKNPVRIQNLYSNYSNFVPFFFQTPNEFVIENIKNIPFEKLLPNSSNQEEKTQKNTINKDNISETKTTSEVTENKELSTTETELPKTKEETTIKPEEPKVKTPEKITEVTNIQITKKYFIVAGSFNDLKNANNYIATLHNKGFNSEIIGQNKYGMYRVSYSVFNTKEEAQKQLAIIKKEEDNSAWIFSK